MRLVDSGQHLSAGKGFVFMYFRKAVFQKLCGNAVRIIVVVAPLGRVPQKVPQNLLAFAFVIFPARFYHVLQCAALIVINHLFDGGQGVEGFGGSAQHNPFFFNGIAFIDHVRGVFNGPVEQPAQVRKRAHGASAVPIGRQALFPDVREVFVKPFFPEFHQMLLGLVKFFRGFPDVRRYFFLVCLKQLVKGGKMHVLIQEVQKDVGQGNIGRHIKIAFPGDIDVLAKVKPVLPGNFYRQPRLGHALYKEVVVIVGNKIAAGNTQLGSPFQKFRWVFAVNPEIELRFRQAHAVNGVQKEHGHFVDRVFPVFQHTAQGHHQLGRILV